MFKNYLKIALRNAWKHKAFAAINICGLAVGVAVCLLMLLYVQDELAYDRFHQKAGRIYRVNMHYSANNVSEQAATTQFPVEPVLLDLDPFFGYLLVKDQTG